MKKRVECNWWPINIENKIIKNKKRGKIIRLSLKTKRAWKLTATSFEISLLRKLRIERGSQRKRIKRILPY